MNLAKSWHCDWVWCFWSLFSCLLYFGLLNGCWLDDYFTDFSDLSLNRFWLWLYWSCIFLVVLQIFNLKKLSEHWAYRFHLVLVQIFFLWSLFLCSWGTAGQERGFRWEKILLDLINSMPDNLRLFFWLGWILSRILFWKLRDGLSRNGLGIDDDRVFLFLLVFFLLLYFVDGFALVLVLALAVSIMVNIVILNLGLSHQFRCLCLILAERIFSDVWIVTQIWRYLSWLHCGDMEFRMAFFYNTGTVWGLL